MNTFSRKVKTDMQNRTAPSATSSPLFTSGMCMTALKADLKSKFQTHISLIVYKSFSKQLQLVGRYSRHIEAIKYTQR